MFRILTTRTGCALLSCVLAVMASNTLAQDFRVKPEPGPPQAPDKSDDRKGLKRPEAKEVPRASGASKEPVLQSVPPVIVLPAGRVKTTKVGDIATIIDPSAANAKRAVDPRRRGPNLSIMPENSQDPDIAAAGDNVYVVWSDFSTGNLEIFLAISTDHGASFWPPVNLSSTTTPSLSPHVAASDDNVYVVWIEEAGLSKGLFTVSNDSGDSFSEPAELDSIPGETYQAKVAASAGRGYAVWIEVPQNFPLLVGAELVRFRDLGGSEVTNVVLVPWHVQDLNIAAGGSNIYLTWNANYRRQDLDPYFSTSTDGGRTFRVDQYAGDQASPRSDYGDQRNGGVAASGNTVVWYYESNRETSRTVLFSASRMAGAGLIERPMYYALNLRTVYQDRTSEAFRATMDPHFVLDGEGRYAGAWVEARPPGFSGAFVSELHYWESDHPDHVLATSGRPRDPQVGAANGTSAVVYTNTTSSGGANRDVFAYMLGGRGGAYNVSENAGNSQQAKVVASGANYVIVWSDDTPGNKEIFFRTIPTR